MVQLEAAPHMLALEAALETLHGAWRVDSAVAADRRRDRDRAPECRDEAAMAVHTLLRG